ncbi:MULTISPECIES: GNAT family N-acetyltransferase [unclassified Pseudoalteromonas]|uniref:GNAT family N-acetyltransferase n=1 Tax=unclassified Pseudoalteromonas TaxID=194690 RepID=UPI0004048239|nr:MULTISPECIES: GNAT family N-acetyltransferase [unclassified Pseudoalteromonas]MBG9991298.1 GNAT family N-acetyltransferase [Pseudoalteromonas sp. NZS37]MBH0060382.1 GNAT family N-acetyltransferase [Pseudoalteromonas sp. NZS71]PKH91500.1 N-acetyltransferase [Pseudoalteromonas sp. 78C3]
MYIVKLLDGLKVPLVNKFYKKHNVRGRANKQDKVWVTYYNNEIVAACRLQDKTEFLFLSTMFVVLEHRGKGVAKQLLSTLLKSQDKMINTFAYKNVVDLYCAIGFNQVLTYTLALQVLFDTYKHRNIVALEYP